MLKILHIISGLKNGGAENTLYKICKYDLANKHTIISLGGIQDKYFKILKDLNIELYTIKLKFFSFLFDFFLIINLIKKKNPHIIQTWLPHADLLGGIAARLAGNKNIVWNFRYSKIINTNLKFYFLTKMLCKFSFIIPKSIICNSKNSIKDHIQLGFNKKKFYFIPNGFDTSHLKADKKKKLLFRKKNKIHNFIPIIGHVGRYSKMKDHDNLLNSLKILKLKKLKFICVLVGPNIDKKNKSLIQKVKENKLEKYVRLLGETNDISLVMNGIDICLLTSKDSEGFPNVLAEAMSCKTPCISTNIGDASYILGKTGWIVQKQNPQKIANAIEEAIIEIKTQSFKKRANLSRERIKKKFNINKMISSYVKLWNKVYQLR